MSQQPPTGPTGAPDASDDDAHRTPGTPEEAGGEPTERLAQSPYDVPEPEETSTYPGYEQAPDPSRTIYADAGSAAPGGEAEEPAPGGTRPRWLVPVVAAVLVLLVAGGVALALLLGGDDDPVAEPTQTPQATEETTAPQETTPAAEETTEAATSPEPTEEPTEEPTSSTELLEDLDETVAVGDLTFTVGEEGFTADEDVEGALEAWRGTYVSGEYEIEMLATLWPDNEAADAFAAELVDQADGTDPRTGDTYTNGMGTYWAFALDEDRGMYIWTTDSGHVLQITGSTDHIDAFFTSLPL